MSDIKPDTFLLGIFDTESYRIHLNKPTVIGYGGLSRMEVCKPRWKEGEMIVKFALGKSFDHLHILTTVATGCLEYNNILFILDDITFPININKSITCAELQMICKIPEFHNKTTFIKYGKIVGLDISIVIK